MEQLELTEEDKIELGILEEDEQPAPLKRKTREVASRIVSAVQPSAAIIRDQPSREVTFADLNGCK
jgi:hypothetical protein